MFSNVIVTMGGSIFFAFRLASLYQFTMGGVLTVHTAHTHPLVHTSMLQLESYYRILDTDWCQQEGTIGGVLSQPQMHEGKLVERVLAYSSKKLTHSQRNYTSYKV